MSDTFKVLDELTQRDTVATMATLYLVVEHALELAGLTANIDKAQLAGILHSELHNEAKRHDIGGV